MVSNHMDASGRPFSTVRGAVLAVWLLAFSTLLHAGTGGFTATLSSDQQSAAGLLTLSAPERAALDQLVAAELALVRQGELRYLASAFFNRRTEAERRAAGLDRLKPAEQTRLNELVAAALAIRPKPKERPRIKDDDILIAAPKPEIHGAVSLAFGWGGGGTYRASSLWLDYFDPASGLGLGIGLANVSGHGFYGYYPTYFGTGDYGLEPAFFDTSYRNALRDAFSYSSGQSFCAPVSGELAGRGHRRH